MWKEITSGLPGVCVIIAFAITFVWIVGTLVAIAVPSHPVPTSVNAIMGAMVTGLFSTAILITYKKKEGD